MVNRYVKSAFGPQNEVITCVGQGHVSPSIDDSKGHPRNVLGIIEDTHSLTTRDEKIGPSDGVQQDQ